MNAVNSKAYQEWQSNCQALFTPEHRHPESDRTVQLEDSYSVRLEAYQGKMGEWNLLRLSVNTLFDPNGRAVFTWRNLNDPGFASLFRHANGKRYLVFRVGLYGYSVLELESGKEFHYIPSEAYPQDGEEFRETFIWAEASYDPKSNLLAVCGCIWAAPYSTIVLDFSDPFAEQPVERWLDIHELVDPTYDLYCHMEFARWENGMLCLNCDRVSDDQTEEIRLPAESLKEKLK